MDKLTVTGTQQADFIPRMVTSQTESGEQVSYMLEIGLKARVWFYRQV